MEQYKNPTAQKMAYYSFYTKEAQGVLIRFSQTEEFIKKCESPEWLLCLLDALEDIRQYFQVIAEEEEDKARG